MRRQRPRAPRAPSTAGSRSPPTASRTGPRAESPTANVTSESGMPSSSAAIWASAVFVPGADILARRDHRRMAVRADPDPGVARRAAAAPPDLRGHARRRASPSRSSGREPRAGAPSAAPPAGSTRAGSCPRRACRRPGPRSAWFRRRSSSGSSSSLRASSSSRPSRPNVPSTKPGARNAFIGGRLSLARTGSRADVRAVRRASASAPRRSSSSPSSRWR